MESSISQVPAGPTGEDILDQEINLLQAQSTPSTCDSS